MSRKTTIARHRAVPTRTNPFVTASRAVTASAAVAGKPAVVAVAASGIMLGAALPASAAGEISTVGTQQAAAAGAVYTVTEWDASGSRTYTTDQWGVPAAAMITATQWGAPAAATYAPAAVAAPVAAPAAASAAGQSGISLQSNQPVVRQSASTAPANGIVGTALAGEGSGYVYGGTSYGAWDCSGFVQSVYAQNGISLPRTTWAQFSALTPTSNPQPGDLVSQNGGSHVGIYLGNGQMISALNSSQGTIQHSVNAMSVDGYYTAR